MGSWGVVGLGMVSCCGCVMGGRGGWWAFVGGVAVGWWLSIGFSVLMGWGGWIGCGSRRGGYVLGTKLRVVERVLMVFGVCI